MTPSPSDSFTRAQRIELIALFGVLTVFTPIGIDLYLPALPTIAADFHSPISVIEQSLAAFFLGLCLGQAMVGPISDRFGRRWPILIGLLLYVAGRHGLRPVARSHHPEPRALCRSRWAAAPARFWRAPVCATCFRPA